MQTQSDGDYKHLAFWGNTINPLIIRSIPMLIYLGQCNPQMSQTQDDEMLYKLAIRLLDSDKQETK